MQRDFYPRSPRGERRGYSVASNGDCDPFLSTLPARGATPACSCFIHALVFLSTLPARGATTLSGAIHEGVNISIHAPREGSDS